MKKFVLLFFLFLFIVRVQAQEKPEKIKKNSLLEAEVGYMANWPFKSAKYKIAVQHTFWNFIGLSAGYWHYADHYLEYGSVNNDIAINSLDFSLGMVPVYTKHSFLSLGGGYSYGYIKKDTPYDVVFNPNTGEIIHVYTYHIKSWDGGWHFYLQYHYNFNYFFIGTSLYYYSFNDINGKPAFSGFNANIVFGIQLK